MEVSIEILKKPKRIILYLHAPRHHPVKLTLRSDGGIGSLARLVAELAEAYAKHCSKYIVEDAMKLKQDVAKIITDPTIEITNITIVNMDTIACMEKLRETAKNLGFEVVDSEALVEELRRIREEILDIATELGIADVAKMLGIDKRIELLARVAERILK